MTREQMLELARHTAGVNAGIAHDYRKGMTMAEIGEKYDMKAHVVRRHLVEAGVEIRRPGQRPRALMSDVAYNGGWVRVGLILRPTRGRAS